MPAAKGATIEPAAAADWPAVVDLLARARLPVDGLEDHRETVLVARSDGRVVGCAALELYRDGALLRSVAVIPGRQGEGLGEQLTRAALALARTRNVCPVYLLTETAAAFFLRFGFRPVARSAVASGVRRSLEFTTVCPVSAQAMALDWVEAGA